MTERERKQHTMRGVILGFALGFVLWGCAYALARWLGHQ